MTVLYSKLSKALLISLKRLSHSMAWKSKVMELLATSPASSLTPPFPTAFAPDTPESLTLCQHSTCILYWGHCACCLLCLGYFSSVFLTLSLPSIIQMLPHQKPSHHIASTPFTVLFSSLHSSLPVFVCLLCVCTSPSFYIPPRCQGFFSYLYLQNLVQCPPWTVSKYLLKERVNWLYNVAAFVSYVTGCWAF